MVVLDAPPGLAQRILAEVHEGNLLDLGTNSRGAYAVRQRGGGEVSRGDADVEMAGREVFAEERFQHRLGRAAPNALHVEAEDPRIVDVEGEWVVHVGTQVRQHDYGGVGVLI